METPTHRLMLEATDETRFTVRVGALKTWCAWRAKAVDPSSLRSALQQRRLGCQPLAGALRAVRHAWGPRGHLCHHSATAAGCSEEPLGAQGSALEALRALCQVPFCPVLRGAIVECWKDQEPETLQRCGDLLGPAELWDLPQELLEPLSATQREAMRNAMPGPSALSLTATLSASQATGSMSHMGAAA